MSSLVLIHVRSAQTKHVGKYLCHFQCNIALQCIESQTTVDKDMTQPAISAFDHFAIDASTQHTASHQEVFFQGARLHHQGRPWVQVVWGVGVHLWEEAPCRRIPKRHWPLALGVSGGWENQVDVRLSWGFLLLPRPQICCSARFSPAAAVVQGVLKNTAVFTTGWDIFFFKKGCSWEVFLAFFQVALNSNLLDYQE